MTDERNINNVVEQVPVAPTTPAGTWEKGLVGAISADQTIVNPFASASAATVSTQTTSNSAPKKK